MRIAVPHQWIDCQGGGPISLLGPDLGNPDKDDGSPLPARLGPFGRFELIDGHHRASARLQSRFLDPIELDVVEVSVLWKRLEGDLLSLYGGQTLYQEIEHPWFDTWEVQRDRARLSAIIASIKSRKGKPALDIGSCTGRFSRQLRRVGFPTYGAETDERVRGIAEHLGAVFGVNVCYRPSIDSLEWAGPGWGPCICLSVFHHLLAAGEVELVKKTYLTLLARSDEVYIDGDAETAASQGYPAWGQQYEGWLKALCGTTHNLTHIGTFDRRPVYRLARIGID